jgi:hypothetical protein
VNVMKLLDIKSKEKRPVTVQMVGHVHNRVGTRVGRDVKTLDRTSGEFRMRRITRKFPPVVRWGAGETVRGLGPEVLKSPVVQSLLRRRRFVVVREYDEIQPGPKAAAPAPAQVVPKRTRRTKTPKE